MADAKWPQVKEIFDAVLQQQPEERAKFLDEACNGDNSVRLEVESLLSSFGRAEGFMQRPAVDGEQPTIRRETFTAGYDLGHYEIIRLLGVGGMGEVYLAKDKKLGREVAIKVLNHKFEKHESGLHRFVQEAKAASALNHPNILVIHDIGESDDAHYIVSEYVEGDTLRGYFEAKGLALAEVLDVSIQIASALVAAHAAQIVHRDIKPENIMVRSDGLAKVLDFGLAKLVENKNRSLLGFDDETVKMNQTEKGIILGTVSYMSPEQAKGEKIDGRTDIFSLGVLIYEMIAGRTPFTGDSMSETFANLINKEPPPMSRYASGVPEELQRIVSKMLRKNSDDRYQTMKGLLGDLKELRENLAFGEKLEHLKAPGQNETAILRAATGEANKQTRETQHSFSQKIKSHKPISAIAAIILFAGMIGFGYWYFANPLISRPEIKSLAVLPLENLSGDPEQEYFADGMTEALISNLSQIGAIKVISRTSVMRYKGSREPLPDIARALGVDAIIEGSVQRSGGRVKVTAQLIPATTDAPMWSRNYERELSDILKLQSDVAQAIAGEIRVQLSPREQNRLASAKTIDPKAHEAYLLGQFYHAKLSEANIARAISYFQQAIEIEPNYADAYAGLSRAWQDRGIWGNSDIGEVEPAAREAAMAAIRIDPGNSNAHTVMAFILMNYDYNWSAAEEEAKRSIEIDPNNAEAYEAYSWLLQDLGRHDEVRPQMERAVQVDPVSARMQSAFGRMLYRARKYDEAEIHLKRAIELDPSSYAAYGRLGDVYIEMGRFDEAVAAFEKSLSMHPHGAHALRIAVVFARMGDRQKALAAMANTSNRQAWELARLHTALGEPGKAFEVLNEAFEKRDTLLVHLKEDPSFDPLHSDPRWKPLMRRLNFPEE